MTISNRDIPREILISSEHEPAEQSIEEELQSLPKAKCSSERKKDGKFAFERSMNWTELYEAEAEEEANTSRNGHRSVPSRVTRSGNRSKLTRMRQRALALRESNSSISSPQYISLSNHTSDSYFCSTSSNPFLYKTPRNQGTTPCRTWQ